MVEELTAENIDERIAENRLMFIYFYAVPCESCEFMNPVIEKLSQIFTNIPFARINIVEYLDIFDKYDIVNTPTMIFFRNGKEAWNGIGQLTLDAILFQIKRYIE
ncbi:MAG: thiol reductase thioredoxin [bacterium]|nr:MAG: thiol reductase thioredoxin [bacterium]